jgi:mannose-6-phosphate isomerase-like protein (cupin superfamily)
MFIRDISRSQEIIAGDNCFLKELINPLKDKDLDLRYSLSVGRIQLGGETYLHRLKNSEVYFLLKGTAEVYINDDVAVVGAGQAIYVPPGGAQRVKNVGSEELLFACIVDPAWEADDEEILVQPE